MSVETTHPPNEHASIFKRLDKCVWSEIRDLDETPIFNFIKLNETQANPSIKNPPNSVVTTGDSHNNSGLSTTEKNTEMLLDALKLCLGSLDSIGHYMVNPRTRSGGCN